MLSGITNYFLGAFFKSEPVPQVTADDSTNPRLTLEDDGDWMLVHNGEPDNSMALVPVRKPSLICMDNSWFITPPACFTVGSRTSLDMSPLENLLIEHPSMSVYHGMPNNKNNQNEDDDIIDYKKANESQRQNKSTKKGAPLKESCPNTNKINQVIQHLQNETQGQKLMQWQQAKFVHMKQLERQNKVLDYQSKNKRQRRKDHSHRPSGRSNDRKCY